MWWGGGSIFSPSFVYQNRLSIDPRYSLDVLSMDPSMDPWWTHRWTLAGLSMDSRLTLDQLSMDPCFTLEIFYRGSIRIDTSVVSSRKLAIDSWRYLNDIKTILPNESSLLSSSLARNDIVTTSFRYRVLSGHSIHWKVGLLEGRSEERRSDHLPPFYLYRLTLPC